MKFDITCDLNPKNFHVKYIDEENNIEDVVIYSPPVDGDNDIEKLFIAFSKSIQQFMLYKAGEVSYEYGNSEVDLSKEEQDELKALTIRTFNKAHNNDPSSQYSIAIECISEARIQNDLEILCIAEKWLRKSVENDYKEAIIYLNEKWDKNKASIQKQIARS